MPSQFAELLKHNPTIYAYPNLQALLEGEAAGGMKTKLPLPDTEPVTERPDKHRT
jgi:hypothetical protein